MAMAHGPEAPGDTAQRDALRAVLAAAGTGTWHWDMATGRVEWDHTLEALSGLRPGEFGSTFEAWLATLHPDEQDAIVRLVQDALDHCQPYQFEHRSLWPDGTVRWLECRGEVVTDTDGNPTGTVGCAIDITDRKLAELEQAALLEEVQGSAERLLRLQRISRHLASALSFDDVVAAVIEVLDPPEGATTRGLWLLDPATGSLVLAAQRGMDPATAEVFARMDAGSDLPGPVALRERRTMVSPTQTDSLERFPDLQGVSRTAQGFITVPLLLEADALGVLAFGYDGPLEEGDVTFLEAAAGNIAQTLQRVRLADALERRSEELAFLADITRAAVTTSDHRELMQHIAATVVPRLGALCAIHFVPEPGAPVEVAVAHADPGRAAPAGELAHLLEFDPATDDGVARVEATVGAGSRVTVPIEADGRVNGALQVVNCDSRPGHSDHDLSLAQAVARGIGEALQSRWLTDQHRHISLSLQQAFLPPVLPTIPGLDIAAAYWPAGVASEVGGDFYDLFAIGDNEWAVLIGDACGTGPDAAATAAIARHTARAAARHGLGHLEVLEWVNQAVKHSDRDLFCTAAYATVRTRSDGTVTIASASGGHPLPIHLGDGGATSLGAPGTLLGIYDDPRFTLHEVSIQVGESVAFYTDGITDLPPPHDRSDDDLRALLGECHKATAAELIDHLRVDLEHRSQDRADDAALLVLRNTGPR